MNAKENTAGMRIKFACATLYSLFSGSRATRHAYGGGAPAGLAQVTRCSAACATIATGRGGDGACHLACALACE
eukprot:6178660-Pleurochrysis_carterae.AAC.2